MTYEDLVMHQKLRIEEPEIKEYKIAEEVFKKYVRKAKPNDIYYGANPVEDLIYNYFEAKKNNQHTKFDKLLDEYNFGYAMSIHNAIYYLLATEDEKVDEVNPLLWPGVLDIKEEYDKYILDTVIGEIKVVQAHKLFSDTPSSSIFKKTLMGNCYNCSYDFVKKNKDYKVILSYMPNFFYGGHYHAYLKKDGKILDIASNAYYEDIDSINKIFCGSVIAKLTYDEIKNQFLKLKKDIPEIKDQQKLLSLALYHDLKNIR